MVKKFAVLYQGHAPPPFKSFDNSTTIAKPLKPGGYKDSSADIACALRSISNTHQLSVILPTNSTPDETQDYDWCFPDTAEGIARAISLGAEYFFINTVLYATHPILQFLDKNNALHITGGIVGHVPALVEEFDDKFHTNCRLASEAQIPVPITIIVSRTKITNNNNSNVIVAHVDDIVAKMNELNLACPVIVKPIRGRGSQGVQLVQTLDKVEQACRDLLQYDWTGGQIMLEEYLSGDEVCWQVLVAATTLLLTFQKS